MRRWPYVLLLCLLLVLCVGYAYAASHPRIIILPGSFLDALGDAVSLLHRSMEGAGIPYVLVDGALLGLCRCGDFVPWDDDIDIMCAYEDGGRIEKALRDASFSVSDKSFGLLAGTPNGVYIDINLISDTKNSGKMQYQGHIDNVRGYLLREEWEGRELATVRGHSVWVPASREAYLCRMYGKDWETNAVVSPKHREQGTYAKTWTRLYRDIWERIRERLAPGT
jgi:hypothetical protein